MLWENLTSNEFPAAVEAAKGVCVLPVGCVEKHGLHLPLGTDILQASQLAYLASQLETVCVAPDFTFGDIPGRSPTLPKGSIGISLELQMRLMEELCDMVGRCGFKKIIIFNGHGGNKPWLTVFLRYMTGKKLPYVVMSNFIQLPIPHEAVKYMDEHGEDSLPMLTKEDIALLRKYHEQNMHIGHACMSETSYMMGLCPEAVHLDRLGIEDGQDRHYTDELRKLHIELASSGWDIDFPNAFEGDDPVGCNERIGEAAYYLETRRLAEVFAFVKQDTDMQKWLDQYQAGWEK